MGSDGLIDAARKVIHPLAFGLLAIVVFWWWLTLAVEGSPADWAFDFRQFWQGGHDVVSGISPYPSRELLATAGDGLDPEGIQEVFRFPYPAGAAVALAPLGLLSFHTAAAVWSAALIVSLLAALAVLGVRDWRVVAVVACSAPVISSVRLGTLTPILVLLLAVAWRVRDRRWGVASALALAIALKIFLWPLVVWLAATRRWLEAAATCALALVFTAVAWATIGFRGLAVYPELVSRLTDVVADRGLSLVALGALAGLPVGGAAATPVARRARAALRGRAARQARERGPRRVLARSDRGDRHHADRVAPLLRRPDRSPRPPLAALRMALAPASRVLVEPRAGERRRPLAHPGGGRRHGRGRRRRDGACATRQGLDGMSVSAVAGARTRSARISVPVALGLTVLAASALHIVLALRIPAPWVMPDELRYSELAKSLGDGGLPSIRGDVDFKFGLGYPLLLAPIWALFDDVAVAYAVAKCLNAVVLGLTAVPAYFLARRFIAEPGALLVAVLSVAIPSLLYAGTLMTEVALYPAFVLGLLAIAVALERPTVATQLGALGAIALAASVKVLAVSLLAGYLAAIPLFHGLDTRTRSGLRTRLRSYASTGIAVVVALAVALVGARALGRSPTFFLGAYGQFVGKADPLELLRWTLYHLAAFDLFLAVIPFAATVLAVAGGLRRAADRRVRLFAVMSVTIGLSLFGAVANYSVNSPTAPFGYAPGAGANERATFVLAPLAFIGLVVWLRDRPWPRVAAVAAGAGAGLLPGVIPLERFAQNVVSVQAFSLIPWVEAGDRIRPGAHARDERRVRRDLRGARLAASPGPRVHRARRGRACGGNARCADVHGADCGLVQARRPRRDHRLD